MRQFYPTIVRLLLCIVVVGCASPKETNVGIQFERRADQSFRFVRNGQSYLLPILRTDDDNKVALAWTDQSKYFVISEGVEEDSPPAYRVYTFTKSGPVSLGIPTADLRKKYPMAVYVFFMGFNTDHKPIFAFGPARFSITEKGRVKDGTEMLDNNQVHKIVLE